jgi:hypothetical protein
MDVSKFQLEGEWLELEVESKNVTGSLEFKVKPLSSDEQIDLAEAGEGNIKDFLLKVNELVLDWNLEDGESKLVCDDENKKKYLPYLIGMRVKLEKGDDSTIEDEEGKKIKVIKSVGLTIISFAQDFGNFVKN